MGTTRSTSTVIDFVILGMVFSVVIVATTLYFHEQMTKESNIER